MILTVIFLYTATLRDEETGVTSVYAAEPQQGCRTDATHMSSVDIALGKVPFDR
jgi:hypothetical protein